MVITRLAPSPTGLLHLGNAWSFLLCWLAARKDDGKVILRFDDIDPQRSRQEYADAIIRDLEWLGFDWDNVEPVWQGQRYGLYENALKKLQVANLTYPCFCARRELRMLANAPHIGDEGVAYPGICARLSEAERAERLAAGKPFAWRFRCSPSEIAFTDLICGPQKYSHIAHGGDFVLRRSDGVWAYQLASVVDDIDLGVNLVLRGRDLLPSTPRQILLARALSAPVPDYAHVPLVLAPDGERLAKRHASLSLTAMREAGIKPKRIIGWLGYKAKILPVNHPAAPSDLLANFALDKLPGNDVISDQNELFQMSET